MKSLNNHVFWVGANDWEVRHFHGFELSTHRGSSYNAYLIKDEKNVLIDTVMEPLTDHFIHRIEEIMDLKEIDYVICNHAEPDHSGALPYLMKQIPDVPLIVSPRGEDSLRHHYHQDWNYKSVRTGDRLNIGKNDLLFVEAPFLHWPDSMFTYLTNDAILFPNDAFGQHYSASELFNDEVDEVEVMQEALKYYANILTPFSKLVNKKIDELLKLNLEIKMIAPSHGIIWRKDPIQIVQNYLKWSEGINEMIVIIIYNSMWGATKTMAQHIGIGLEQAGIPYKLFNVSTADRNDVLTEIFQSKGLICGSSTINNGILASLTPVLDELKGLKYTNKVGASFGSYGWGGEGTKILDHLLAEANISILQEPLKIKYMPSEEEIITCEQFGKSFGEKMKKL